VFGIDDVAEIERAIQLAIAPAFLLTGIFSLLNVVCSRLARLVDRERTIRNGNSPALPGEPAHLGLLVRYGHHAIAYCVTAAILLCSLIVVSFGGVFFGLRVALVLAVLLILAMFSLASALVLFLLEVRLAARHLPLDD
jgi:predicted signal transduction protein with EAL and GGDEF domain